MRWQGGRESGNVEDRRSASGPVMIGGGLGTVAVVVVLMLLGVDPRVVMQMAGPRGGARQAQQGPREVNPEEEELKRFVSVILADTEDVWTEQFRKIGREYRPPKLVLFTGQVESACGSATAASGPFYCPEDEKVYIDLGFYRVMRERLGADGDFAQAYVIAHEVGHHVQKQLGTLQKVHALQGRVSKTQYNQASVRLELQADFLAGVWAHHAQEARNILEQGDIEEGLNAASAIGDDKLQRESQGYVVPDSFTHGTSEQRVRWFKKGLQSGDIRQGDTFEGTGI